MSESVRRIGSGDLWNMTVFRVEGLEAWVDENALVAYGM